jgi:transcriptional regulator with XRE-family HTH domain
MSSEADEWRELGRPVARDPRIPELVQADVAAATGIARSAVSDIERGQRKVDSLELRKFSKLYRYPVSYILGEVEASSESAQALARAVTDLTDADRQEVLKFAQFLRFSADKASTDRSGT